ncbi:MAG: metal-dependent hydrolase [Nitrospinota bacterium]|jgi:membrane-bound metal-dependent hydrolase YbcI (DUF457 family)|nr:metal-dependent hydrolase [Nitrospinota bacterium]
MNTVFHAAAGSSPDWDGLLFFRGRELFFRYHRSLTHSVLGVLAGALLAAGILSSYGGWNFSRLAGLWLLAVGGHTLADIFTRSGVALLYPFSDERWRVLALPWGGVPLTAGALSLALWALAFPAAARPAAALGLAGFAAYLLVRCRNLRPLVRLSRWWFDQVYGVAGAGKNFFPASDSPRNGGISRDLR